MVRKELWGYLLGDNLMRSGSAFSADGPTVGHPAAGNGSAGGGDYAAGASGVGAAGRMSFVSVPLRAFRSNRPKISEAFRLRE